MTDPDVAGARRDAWRRYAATPWGRLRYRVVAHTVTRLVAGRTDLRVLDVGGGDGRDVLPLARAGHEVTVLDPSRVLLDDAVAAAAAAGCEDRLAVVVGGIDDLRGSGLADFDLVLCHDVLQYHGDLRRGVGAVVAAAASGGLVSLLCPNPAAEVLIGLARGGDPGAALADLDVPTSRSETFATTVARVPVEAAERALVAAGCEPVHRFGVRCVTDLVPDDAGKADPERYAALEALELALCDREPYLRTARFWQLVGRPF